MISFRQQSKSFVKLCLETTATTIVIFISCLLTNFKILFTDHSFPDHKLFWRILHWSLNICRCFCLSLRSQLSPYSDLMESGTVKACLSHASRYLEIFSGQIQTLSSPVGAVVEIISVPHKRLMTDFGLPAFMITFIIIFIKESLPLPLQTWHVWQQCKAPNPILEQEQISLLFLCYR